MRRFVEGIDRGQATLFPECLEDWIDADNPVRVIDAFVEKLDLSGLGLRARRQRPRRRAAEQRDELAPPHSITSSARASSVGGTSRPSALAVLRLISMSNLVGCSTGRSAGFAPLKILSTYSAARRSMTSGFGP